MPVNIIPFKMPKPAEIPTHIVSGLQQMAPDQAVVRGMELLLEIEAAETILYERVEANGNLEWGASVSQDAAKADQLKEQLAASYGQPLNDAHETLAHQAFTQDSALLVMGQVAAGDPSVMPQALLDFLLGGAVSGSIGFNYVLPLATANQTPLGTLTLIRPGDSGPLNHEQPNLTEGLRQIIVGVLSD
jgi:hypothetical protein